MHVICLLCWTAKVTVHASNACLRHTIGMVIALHIQVDIIAAALKNRNKTTRMRQHLQLLSRLWH